MATTKRKSRILSEVHEMASDLHSVGLIDKRRMREFDALCNLDIEDFGPGKIKALRQKERVSQAVFAAALNTSVSTVQKWEIGDKRPSGPSLKLLNLVKRKGFAVLL